MHDLVKIPADLAVCGKLIKTLVPAGRVDRIVAQFFGIDSVESRRLVQSHVRVSIVPVTTGLVVFVYNDDVCFGLC